MKSVLHIITGLENGGAEAVLYRLVTNDRNNRHTVISMMGPGKYGSLLHQNGIEVYCLNMPKGKFTVSGAIHLWKLIRKLKPDLLQTWMYHADLLGGILGRLAGIKKVYWCIHNSTLVRGATSWKTLLVTKFCAALSYFVPRKIVSCAQKAIDVNVTQGYELSKFCLVPNGYDVTEFRPDADAGKRMRDEWRMTEHRFLMGMVARFDPQKDIPNFLDAIAMVSHSSFDFHVILVGSGMEASNPELRQWLGDRGIVDKVTLIGQRNDIPAVMNAFDILVLSSQYGEAFPNVLCEAMACGTLCVATAVGDSEVIIADTGWVVPPRSAELMANAMREAIQSRQDPGNWASRRIKARMRIEENFDIKKMVDGYQRVWDL